MSDHVVSLKVYIAVFTALIILTIVTVVVANIDLGRANDLVALGIAMTKALLVILYFMHIRYGNKLLWVVVSAGFFWLGILLVLIMSDYLTRGWLTFPGKWPL
jgi:cytochrome c oxidase subunit IV